MSKAVDAWVRSKADEKAIDQGCYFDLEAADRVRRFFAKFLRHSKGQQFAGKPFELLDWQWLDVVAPAYGWKKANGLRRYRRVTVWVPKKNGKSTLAAGLILYGLVADGEPGAEVYGAAADRNQAGIIFKEVTAMVEQSPALAGQLVTLGLKVDYPAKHSFYQILSKDSRKTGHGVNSHLTVIDELHVVNRELYGTLRYAGAARSQPLMIEISTAGNDKTSLGYERYTYAKRLLKGEIQDQETLAVVYEADSNEVWDQPEQWRKANPSLGVTIKEEGFRSDFTEAENGTATNQGEFKQLRLNLWQEQVFNWLALEQWDANAISIDLESLKGYPCWGSLDLASKLDLCCWCKLFELPDCYVVVFVFWAPEEADSKRQKENKALLRPWMMTGDIIATEGSVTDYDIIEKKVKEDCAEYQIIEVAYDPWNATHVANHLAAEGIVVVEFGQTIRNFNEPMKEAEKLLKEGRQKHDGSPVMRWMIGHTQARKDANGNIRPDKERSADHIDGPVSWLMALGRAIVKPVEQSIYETQSLEVFGWDS